MVESGLGNSDRTAARPKPYGLSTLTVQILRGAAVALDGWVGVHEDVTLEATFKSFGHF